MLNVENKTKWILSGVIALVSLGYIFASFGRSEWVLYTTSGIGILLGLFILGEAGVVGYVRGKKWRTISAGDLMVWVSFVVGTIVILNSVFLVNAVRNVSPDWLLSFLSVNGALFGGLGGILAIALLLTPKPQ